MPFGQTFGTLSPEQQAFYDRIYGAYGSFQNKLPFGQSRPMFPTGTPGFGNLTYGAPIHQAAPMEPFFGPQEQDEEEIIARQIAAKQAAGPPDRDGEMGGQPGPGEPGFDRGIGYSKEYDAAALQRAQAVRGALNTVAGKVGMAAAPAGIGLGVNQAAAHKSDRVFDWTEERRGVKYSRRMDPETEEPITKEQFVTENPDYFTQKALDDLMTPAEIAERDAYNKAQNPKQVMKDVMAKPWGGAVAPDVPFDLTPWFEREVYNPIRDMLTDTPEAQTPVPAGAEPEPVPEWQRVQDIMQPATTPVAAPAITSPFGYGQLTPIAARRAAIGGAPVIEHVPPGADTPAGRDEPSYRESYYGPSRGEERHGGEAEAAAAERDREQRERDREHDRDENTSEDEAFHGGTGFVPRSKEYDLKRGEAVLPPWMVQQIGPQNIQSAIDQGEDQEPDFAAWENFHREAIKPQSAVKVERPQAPDKSKLFPAIPPSLGPMARGNQMPETVTTRTTRGGGGGKAGATDLFGIVKDVATLGGGGGGGGLGPLPPGAKDITGQMPWLGT